MKNDNYPKEIALALIANTVEDYDDLAKVQAETGVPMETLEAMFYSII